MDDSLDLLIQASIDHDCEKFLKCVALDIASGIIHADKGLLYRGNNPIHLFMPSSRQSPINPDTPARIRVIKQLLKWKADINEKNFLEKTPLYIAVGHKDVAIIPFLLENGAIIRMQQLKQRPSNTHTIPTHTIPTLAYQHFIWGGDSEMPMIKMFMLKGIKPEEFTKFESPSKKMMQFYECIVSARKIASILVGIHKCKKSPLVAICGKDCINLIARIVYSTRGNSIWMHSPKI